MKQKNGAILYVNGMVSWRGELIIELLVGHVCIFQESEKIAADGLLKSNRRECDPRRIIAFTRRSGCREPSLHHYLQKLFQWSQEFHAPIPLVNMINGGKHADSNLPWQEFWVVPNGPQTYKARVEMAATIFHALGHVLQKRGWDRDVGLEGGYAPDVASTDEVWRAIHEGIEQAGYAVGTDCVLGMDAAASELYDAATRQYRDDLAGKTYTAQELSQLFQSWQKDYGVTLLEDGCDQEAWEDWDVLMRDLGKTTTLIGDDLFATNPTRLKKGIARGVANGIIIKPNQIGTLTETMTTIRMAREAGYAVVLSHRSGETNDAFIADLAVTVAAEYVKVGSMSRGERVAKHNRLMAIEEEFHA